MPFDWEEYLAIAKVHIGYHPNVHPCQEAKDRCAMSRAYYAALKVTHEYVQSRWESADVGSSGGVHTRLPKWLKQQRDTELRDIGEKLSRLRKKRDRADYEKRDFHRAFDEAHNSVLDSSAIISAIKNMG